MSFEYLKSWPFWLILLIPCYFLITMIPLFLPGNKVPETVHRSFRTSEIAGNTERIIAPRIQPEVTQAPSASTLTTTVNSLQKCLDKAMVPLITIQGHQFYLSDNSGDMKSWKSSRTFCLENGMDLATIENEQENNAIFSYLNTHYNGNKKYNHIWIGGQRISGSLRWISSNQPIHYTNIDHSKPKSRHQEDCLYVNPTNSGLLWNDFICSFKRPFLCKVLGPCN